MINFIISQSVSSTGSMLLPIFRIIFLDPESELALSLHFGKFDLLFSFFLSNGQLSLNISFDNEISPLRHLLKF